MKTRNKNYLTFSVVIILLGLFFVLLIPKLDSINKNNEHIAEEKRKIENYSDREKSIKEVLEQGKDFEEINDLLTGSLVDKENTLDYILPLENLAKNIGVKQNLEIVENVADKQNDDKDNEYPLEKLDGVKVIVMLEGGYIKILEYLNNLNGMGIYFDMTNVKIARKDYVEGSGKILNNDDENVEIRAVIELKIFSK